MGEAQDNIDGQAAAQDGASKRLRAGADPVQAKADRKVALACFCAFAFMGGMSYAAVPLYRIFCQVTGYGGTTQRAEKPSTGVIDRLMKVRFDGNVTPGMPWEFGPEKTVITVKVGENTLAFFKAHNTSDKPVTGTASFNVSPDIAGQYFTKVECFCFTEQTLQPGEAVDMPVSFYIDPAVANDRDARGLREITLSYTFYPVADGKKSAEAVGTAGKPKSGG